MKSKILPVLCLLIFVSIGSSFLIAGTAAGNSLASTDQENPVYLPMITSNVHFASAIVDDVIVMVASPFMPGILKASDPGDANQLASAFTLIPFQEFSIISIPFGTIPLTEDLPIAESGGAELYRSSLVDLRTQQGGTPVSGSTVKLFGQEITGSYSIIDLKTYSQVSQPMLIVEWVVEFQSRLWIVRISRDLSDGADAESFISSLQRLTIEAVGEPTQALLAQSNIGDSATRELSDNSIATLPTPDWWEGECNDTNFFAGTGIHSYSLGDPYDGLVACGPLNSLHLVDFFDGALTQYEWQCVELAKRYLYLKYDIEPYAAHGRDVVNNIPEEYIGTTFEQIWNGTVNQAPSEGDVISLGPTTTYGHVAVVTSANVDSSGNGQIDIIEQNWSQSGHRSLPVVRWEVGGSMTVINWLHEIEFNGPIAFIRNENIWKVDADGSDATQLTFNGGYSGPAWSRQGDQIAYIHQFSISDKAAWEVGVYNLATHQSRVVVPAELTGFILIGNYFQYSNPRWSPDGSSVYYLASDGRVGGDYIHKVDIQTGAKDQNFTTFFTRRFDIAPQTGRIVFTDFSNAPPIIGYGLYLANADGSQKYSIVPLAAEVYFGTPRWSPDETSFAVIANGDRYGTGSIARFDPQGALLDVFAQQISEYYSAILDWSPDGQNLIYDSQGILYIVNTITRGLIPFVSGVAPTWGSLIDT